MDFKKLLISLAVNAAITSIENTFPMLKGPEKYEKALELLDILGVTIDPEIEAMIELQIAGLNSLGVFKKPGDYDMPF
jgi:hypothetical protein